MNPARLKTHLARWREWELNPIVLKELRQAVRSWSVTGMLLLFLLVLFVTSMGFLVNQSFQVTANEQLGGDLFRAFLAILAAAGILFIPLYLGIRVAVERADNHPDLLYISTLTPGRIIRGKFSCGAHLALLFFSACLPFMALTNLLRGVDLPTVFFLLAYLFLVVCSVNLAAIFIACLPLSRLFKILLGLAGLTLLFFLLSGTMLAAFEMMESGVGVRLLERDFWQVCLTFLGLAMAVGGLFYVLSVALISPPSANRALAPRVYLTVIWLLGGGLAAGAAVKSGDPMLILVWTYVGSILLIAALVVTISNHDQLSVRVRRTIPRRGLLRMPAFCFYNGAAGGLIWVAGLASLTFWGTEGFWHWAPGAYSAGSWGTVRTDIDVFPPMAFYFFAYALFALFIQRRFLPRRAPKITGVLAVFITALTALGINIALFFMNELSWRSIEHLQLGNAFNLMGQLEAGQQKKHLLFALFLLLVALVLNAKWFFTQWRNFRPPAETVSPKPG